MSTISSVGSAGSAWSDLTSSRAATRKDKMFEKVDSNGDGSVDTSELQTMLDKIASKTGGSLGSASNLMSTMDTDGNGTLSADELDDGMKSLMPPPSSTVDFAQQRSDMDAGGMPPPPPPDDASSGSGASGTSTTTSTDPLDTNGDGVVSASELAAGQFKDLLTSLSAALDSSSTGTLSADQADAFKSQFDAAISSMASAQSAGTSSGSGDGSSSSSSSSQSQGLDLSALADLVLKQYSQTASNVAASANLSVAA